MVEKGGSRKMVKVVIEYIAVFLFGYILGCSNMAMYMSKLYKVDLRNNGSKNLGTSNVIMLIGKEAGILVLIHDIGKGILAVYLAGRIFNNVEYSTVIAGVGAVIGHIYPFWLKFKGGKGFATFIGMSVTLDYKVGLIILLVAIIIALISDKIVMGTFITTTLNVIYRLIAGSYIAGLVMLPLVVLIFYLHRSNIKCIISGTEPSIRKALSGKYKKNN